MYLKIPPPPLINAPLDWLPWAGTLVQDALVRFVFDTMAGNKGFCSRQDVRDLVSLLHSDPGRVRQTTASLVAIMDPHNRDMISFETFRCSTVPYGAAKAV